MNPRVGYATVYRTLKLLKECGLAAERHFDDGQARYETVEEEEQHDHIICERCGKIVEFASEELERLQDQIARILGFVVARHKMELYGMCADCRAGRTVRSSAKRDHRVHTALAAPGTLPASAATSPNGASTTAVVRREKHRREWGRRKRTDDHQLRLRRTGSR